MTSRVLAERSAKALSSSANAAPSSITANWSGETMDEAEAFMVGSADIGITTLAKGGGPRRSIMDGMMDFRYCRTSPGWCKMLDVDFSPSVVTAQLGPNASTPDRPVRIPQHPIGSVDTFVIFAAVGTRRRDYELDRVVNLRDVPSNIRDKEAKDDKQ
ncbi:hypothetical protein PISMIDRAFT_25311 [Pisolithus microcarpus 441]|uniref:Unplaced genomic scaffold scaffold_225, whole genome shotgun sequence n=1 Tax=Pisolithus microcarpus 441 TaxID=765257 RepID=A0A0C9YEQ7_9AGAM|nr:hypothetical protein PISMIDRAFT_25311 [Pisolithus microcarpus 441]